MLLYPRSAANSVARGLEMRQGAVMAGAIKCDRGDSVAKAAKKKEEEGVGGFWMCREVPHKCCQSREPRMILSELRLP